LRIVCLHHVFCLLGLAPSLVHAAQRHGLLAPTAIQTQALPAILDGQDLRACAPTGSGKTAAYVLPLLQRWMLADAPTGPRSTQTLVLVPTREPARWPNWSTTWARPWASAPRWPC
jgi:superfamily II DNA/RNA helicase